MGFFTRRRTRTSKNHPRVIRDAVDSQHTDRRERQREVLLIRSPTGFVLGSRSPQWQSITHHALGIKNINGRDGVIKRELIRAHGNKVAQTTTCVKLRADQLKDATILGYTTMTDLEIDQEADALIKSHGTYNLASRNCQHFAKNLAKSIIDTTIVEPDSDVRYNFTNEYLKFMSSFEYSSRPGWILPTPTKILVNVTQTDDADTWSGQVEGSEECGKFFRSAVERAFRPV